MSRIPIALQLYTVRELLALDPAKTLREIAKIGYEGVEGGPPAGMSPQDFRTLLEDEGLRLIGGGTSVQALLRDVEGVARTASELGINTLMLGIQGELNRSGGDWKAAISLLEAGCAKAHEAGLRILYHNHAFELEQSVDGLPALDYIFQAVPAERLQAEIDVYWVKTAGMDPVRYIETYAGRIPFLHVKDRAPSPADRACPFAEVGYGILDWPAILGAARRAGVEWYVVEQDRCVRHPLESIRMSLEYLTKQRE